MAPKSIFFNFFLPLMVNFWGNGVTNPPKKFISVCSTLNFLVYDVKCTFLTSKWPQKVFFSIFWPIMVNFGAKRGHDPPKKVHQRMRTRNSLDFLWVH